MSDTILHLENLTKIYRRSHMWKTKVTTGIDDVSIEIKKGECFGLVGLNGSGKTTTIKLVLGLLFPTKGRVRVYDYDVPHPFAQQRIGYLPEVPYFYRNLTPREVLTLYSSLSKMESASIPYRIDHVLEQVKMTHAKNKQMKEFSKGMLQRIGLAQALIHDPEVLILDEPVTGLDPFGLKQIRDLISDLHKEGKTILFSSHNINEVGKLADRVGLLVEGKLARVIDKKEWHNQGEALEKIFIDVVTETGTSVIV